MEWASPADACSGFPPARAWLACESGRGRVDGAGRGVIRAMRVSEKRPLPPVLRRWSLDGPSDVRCVQEVVQESTSGAPTIPGCPPVGEGGDRSGAHRGHSGRSGRPGPGIGNSACTRTDTAPWQNGYSESCNGKLRDELLSQELFATLSEAACSPSAGGATTTSRAHTARSATFLRPRSQPRSTPNRRRHCHSRWYEEWGLVSRISHPPARTAVSCISP